MRSIIALTLASAGLASAQAVYGPEGTFTCTKPNAAYCAGDSLGTDIIIRCNGTVGQPGRCGNNLAGQPPLGSGGALCYQTSPEAGDAACEKNCVVYASSTFTLPTSLCKPTYTATTQSLSTTIIIETPHPTNSLSTTIIIETIPTSKKTTSTTCTGSLTTTTKKTTAKTTDTTCTASLSTTIIVEPIPTSYSQHNTSLTKPTTTFITTPTGTNRPPPAVTAGAANNKAMGGLAAVGFVAAYLL